MTFLPHVVSEEKHTAPMEKCEPKGRHSFGMLIRKEIGAGAPSVRRLHRTTVPLNRKLKITFLLTSWDTVALPPHVQFSDPSICYHPLPSHCGRCLFSWSPSVLFSILPSACSHLPLVFQVTPFSLDLSLSSESPLKLEISRIFALILWFPHQFAFFFK